MQECNQKYEKKKLKSTENCKLVAKLNKQNKRLKRINKIIITFNICMCIIFLFILASMAFVWQQKHATHPLIPNHLFKNKRFLAYNAISFILGFAGYSSLFGGVSKSMLKKSRLDFDKIEKCE